MKKIILPLIGLTFCGLQSCVDLDMAPHNQIASGNMWTNSALTNAGVAAIYQGLRGWGVYNTDYANATPAFEALGMTTDAYRTPPYTKGTAGSSDGLFSHAWKNFYEGVHRANSTIEALSQPGGGGIDEETRLRLLCESKFLRAFYYTRLNELFGRYGLGVPLYLKPLESVDECTKGQSPEAEVWAQVIQDLTDCIDEPNFPDHYAETGRACKGAAYTLRGRVYLMLGAKYNYDNAVGTVTSTTIDEELLRKAIADFEKVGQCGFGLFQGGYKELFTEENEGCEEMIFAVSNTDKLEGYGNSTQRYCGTRSMVGRDGVEGWSYFSPSNALVDLYEYKNEQRDFDWNDIIPGYFDLSPNDRLIYFLRDSLDNGAILGGPELRKVLRQKINYVSEQNRNLYLPDGNEARLKKAWENRDPRLRYNVILPYDEPYYGGDSQRLNAGDLNPIPYVFRWPVKQSRHYVDLQEDPSWGVSAPYDLMQDGNSEAEFAYRYRKFVMEGYECEYAQDSPIDEPIYRYAYVLLMWAEALAQLDDLDGAADKVNQVRQRPSVEMWPYTFSDKEDALNKIRNESRRELCMEGVNFFEEFRWGTLRQTEFEPFMNYQAGSKTCPGFQSSGNGGASWSKTNDYSIFPVPSTEIEKNPNLQKTPGWLY